MFVKERELKLGNIFIRLLAAFFMLSLFLMPIEISHAAVSQPCSNLGSCPKCGRSVAYRCAIINGQHDHRCMICDPYTPPPPSTPTPPPTYTPKPTRKGCF